MQEVITYIIITATILYILYKIKSMFVVTKSRSSCETFGCSGCSVSKLNSCNKRTKKIISLIGILLISGNSIVHAQNNDAKEAIEFNTTVTGDFARNFSGGIQKDNAYLGNIDITATFSTEKAKLWKGGTFFAYFLNNHGNSLSQHIGDLQGADNIEADAHSRLYQFWYKQELGDFSITVGQHDLNSEFCASEYGGSFINSSFGIQPDISANIPVSIFPVATLGAILKYQINNNIAVLGAIYDGDPGDQETNPNSVDIRWDKSEGTACIVEFQYLLEKEGAFYRSFKLGSWSHNIDHHYGVYAIIDQKLWSESIDKNQGLAFFSQLGGSPHNHGYIDSYYSLGLHYTGLIKGRDEDNLGLAIGNATLEKDFNRHHSNENLSNEIVMELTYSAKVNKFFSIQPDLQYVIKPGGSRNIDDAVVGILRIVAEF